MDTNKKLKCLINMKPYLDKGSVQMYIGDPK